MADGEYLTESEWTELLREIHDRQVIPIVGPELVTVPDPATGQPTVLYGVLAAQLAAALGVPLDPTKPPSLNTVAGDFLHRGGKPKRIYSELSALLNAHSAAPSPALRDLASIADFDLFLAGTIDSQLARAVALERPAFRSTEHVRAYNYNSPIDLPNDLGPGHVYHLVGSPQTLPHFAVWDEDFLVFIRSLIRHEGQLENLFRQLKTRYLLFIGTSFTDWLVRLFLFVVKDARFSDRRRDDIWACLADRGEILGQPLIFFFDQVVGTTRIIQGDPAGFVTELAGRWEKLYGRPASDADAPFAQIPDELPRGAVFVSYSRDDLPAVATLVRSLRGAGIPMWLDQHRLRAGENYERSLEDAVKNRCSFFLSVISRATEGDGRRFVHQERLWAEERHVDGFAFYLPVIIDDTAQPALEPPKFAKVHFERLPAGTVNPTFAAHLSQLVEEWRVSGQPRA